jgi:hypothetical protein
MNEIGVDQSAGDKPVILVTHADRRWPEDQIIDDFRAIKRGNGNKAGKDYDSQRNCEHSNFF